MHVSAATCTWCSLTDISRVIKINWATPCKKNANIENIIKVKPLSTCASSLYKNMEAFLFTRNQIPCKQVCEFTEESYPQPRISSKKIESTRHKGKTWARVQVFFMNLLIEFEILLLLGTSSGHSLHLHMLNNNIPLHRQTYHHN